MSAWKRVALEKLPEYRHLIETADTPGQLWVRLSDAFLAAYEPEVLDDGLIRRFFEYARWCCASPGTENYLSEAGTAAVYGFYEHLPIHEKIRRDLSRRISQTEFNALEGVFRYLPSEKEFAAFKIEFFRESTRWKLNRK